MSPDQRVAPLQSNWWRPLHQPARMQARQHVSQQRHGRSHHHHHHHHQRLCCCGQCAAGALAGDQLHLCLQALRHPRPLSSTGNAGTHARSDALSVTRTGVRPQRFHRHHQHCTHRRHQQQTLASAAAAAAVAIEGCCVWMTRVTGATLQWQTESPCQAGPGGGDGCFGTAGQAGERGLLPCSLTLCLKMMMTVVVVVVVTKTLLAIAAPRNARARGAAALHRPLCRCDARVQCHCQRLRGDPRCCPRDGARRRPGHRAARLQPTAAAAAAGEVVVAVAAVLGWSLGGAGWRCCFQRLRCGWRSGGCGARLLAIRASASARAGSQTHR